MTHALRGDEGQEEEGEGEGDEKEEAKERPVLISSSCLSL